MPVRRKMLIRSVDGFYEAVERRGIRGNPNCQGTFSMLIDEVKVKVSSEGEVVLLSSNTGSKVDVDATPILGGARGQRLLRNFMPS